MRTAALDISKNKVGVAFSDEDCCIIVFSDTLDTKKNQKFKNQFKKLFDNYQPELTLIGMPYVDPPSQSMKFIKSFAHNHRNIIGEFKFIDESFSTFYEHSNPLYINKKKQLDEMVARSLLLNYMAGNRS